MGLLLAALLWLGVALMTAHAAPFLNEILFNPPGAEDVPNEYLEIRGTPNAILPAGTYLVCVEGDKGGNPGTIQNTFELSGQLIGGNGFLVLLQKTNTYTPNTNVALLVNTGRGPGWGSGSSSSISHNGEDNQTDLENGSCTFFLIQTANLPAIGADIDADNDGVPDGGGYGDWTILDSVGVLDADGAGDIAYGAINFRRRTSPGNGATAFGVIVPVDFTPSYIGRAGNTTGSTAADWVGSDSLGGNAPDWTLGTGINTMPTNLAGVALNHLGAPNFGAPALPGMLVSAALNGCEVSEDGARDSYAIALNTLPAGRVTVQLAADAQVQCSTDGGLTFGSLGSVTLSNTLPRVVMVRAVDDHWVETRPHTAWIVHHISATEDPAQYPTNTLVASAKANIMDNDIVWLSEVKVNPPGEDAPFEFIEIRGAPYAALTNVYLAALEGSATDNPGKVDLMVDLTAVTLGPNGLALIAATNSPYLIPPETALVAKPDFSKAGGVLDNDALSILLFVSASTVSKGEDLDNGNNGILEGLPKDATILDAVGWVGDTNDLVYGGASLVLEHGTPDAATRFPGNNQSCSAAAWFCGKLAGTNGASLLYDEDHVSTNYPAGTPLTPGLVNNTAPTISHLAALSGVIGDPTNPPAAFSVADTETPADALAVTVASGNPAVVPDENLSLVKGPGGACTVRLDPIGVGYATITIRVSDGAMTGEASLAYAASAMGRTNGIFLTGASDASAAMPINADWMFVGDDENQVLRVYNRHRSGGPVAQFNMTPFLGLTDLENGVPREVDIEAATRAGNRIFWIGAHSHANLAEGRTNRSRIFATEVYGAGTNSTLTYVGRYDFLKLDLVNWDLNNAHGKGPNYYGLADSTVEGVNPKSPEGFNIEGLAMAPGSTNTAYVALRAPIIPATNRHYALLVPVLNFASLAASDGPPGSAVFGPPIELDLFGRGFRDLKGDTNGYLIIAGTPLNVPGPYPDDFKLYTWSGRPEDPPHELAADLSGLNPEAIVELPPRPWMADTLVQLVSDNGTRIYYDDGIPAKLLPERNFRKFRCDGVALGPVVKSAPLIRSLGWTNGHLSLTWRAVAGDTYRVQYKSALAGGRWLDLAGDVAAAGPVASATDTNVVLFPRFYRLLVLP